MVARCPRLSSPSRTIDGRPFEGPRSIRASDIIAALSVIGIDVSRDWLDGFCLPGLHRFRPTNCAEGCVFRKFPDRSEEHTSVQSLMRISYAVFCLKIKKYTNTNHVRTNTILRILLKQ